MNEVIYPFAAASLLVAALATISIWSHHRLWLKVTAVILVALFLPAAHFAIVDLLSRPKPVSLEWSAQHLAEATVLGAQFKEGDRIFLWLRVDGVEEPRYYAQPWNEEVAKQLYGAQQEAEDMGTEVRMKQPLARTHDESEMMFYAVPQPVLPPKQAPASDSYYFNSEIESEDRGV